MTEEVVAEIRSHIDAALLHSVWRQQIASGDSRSYTLNMEIAAKLSRLEETLQRIEPTLARVDERLNHTATKTELANLDKRLDDVASKEDVTRLSGKIDRMEVSISSKPGKTFVITTIGLMISLVIGAIAVAPYLRHSLGD